LTVLTPGSPGVISVTPRKTTDFRHFPPPFRTARSLNQQRKPNQSNHMASIKPLGQRVLVKRLDAEAVSAGGIVLPDTAKEKPQEAEVLSLGTGGLDEKGNKLEFTVKVGDKVLISKYGGTEVKIDGQEVLIISESDILGIVA
jgi:chaperonin GroES